MTIKFFKGKAASDEDILLTEMEIGAPLPEPYRRFVKEFDGAIPESNIFKFKSNNNAGVSEFIAIRKIVAQRKMIDGFVEDGYPIALASGGNYIFLKKHPQGSVHFWDHEDNRRTYPLAPSFDEFLSMLAPFDVNSVKLQPGQVKKVWIDPEFLKSINKPKS